MRLPRDVSATDLVKALGALGYQVTRQKGSHLRITTLQGGERHEVVPNHHPIKVGTLHSILKSVADHHALSMERLLQDLDL